MSLSLSLSTPPLIQFLSVSNGFPSFLLFLSLTKNPNPNPNPTVGSFKIHTTFVCLSQIDQRRETQRYVFFILLPSNSHPLFLFLLVCLILPACLEFELDRNPARSFPKSIYFDVRAQFVMYPFHCSYHFFFKKKNKIIYSGN